MNENIVTGKKYRILVDELSNLWDRISFWTKASDVEFDDGTVLESKMNDVASKADTADSKARTAQEEAAEAHTRANTAYTNADTAQALASNAWQLAENADAKAISVQSTVNNITQGVTRTVPIDHAFKNPSGGFGVGNNESYGHVKLTDEYNDNLGASSGYASTPKAAYGILTQLTATSDSGIHVFDFAWKDGKYGYNIGGTFHPFNSLEGGCSVAGKGEQKTSTFSQVSVTSGDWYLVIDSGQALETGDSKITGITVSYTGSQLYHVGSSSIECKVRFIIGKASDSKITFNRSYNEAYYAYIVVKLGA